MPVCSIGMEDQHPVTIGNGCCYCLPFIPKALTWVVNQIKRLWQKLFYNSEKILKSFESFQLQNFRYFSEKQFPEIAKITIYPEGREFIEQRRRKFTPQFEHLCSLIKTCDRACNTFNDADDIALRQKFLQKVTCEQLIALFYNVPSETIGDELLKRYRLCINSELEQVHSFTNPNAVRATHFFDAIICKDAKSYPEISSRGLQLYKKFTPGEKELFISQLTEDQKEILFYVLATRLDENDLKKEVQLISHVAKNPNGLVLRFSVHFNHDRVKAINVLCRMLQLKPENFSLFQKTENKEQSAPKQAPPQSQNQPYQRYLDGPCTDTADLFCECILHEKNPLPLLQEISPDSWNKFLALLSPKQLLNLCAKKVDSPLNQYALLFLYAKKEQFEKEIEEFSQDLTESQVDCAFANSYTITQELENKDLDKAHAYFQTVIVRGTKKFFLDGKYAHVYEGTKFDLKGRCISICSAKELMLLKTRLNGMEVYTFVKEEHLQEYLNSQEDGVLFDTVRYLDLKRIELHAWKICQTILEIFLLKKQKKQPIWDNLETGIIALCEKFNDYLNFPGTFSKYCESNRILKGLILAVLKLPRQVPAKK